MLPTHRTQDDIAWELGRELCFQFRFSIATWRAALFYVSGVKKEAKDLYVCVCAFGVNGHLDDDKGDVVVENGPFLRETFLEEKLCQVSALRAWEIAVLDEWP